MNEIKMFNVEPTTEQKKYAWQQVTDYNFGKRGIFDGKKKQQYAGILAQTVMADNIEYPRPNGKDGFDNGIDFIIHNIKCDLKVTGREYYMKNHYSHNIVASQLSYETEIYILGSVNYKTGIITYCGLIRKDQMKRYFHPAGTIRTRDDGTTFTYKVASYDVPQSDLHQIKNWLDIIWGVDQIL